MAPRTASPPYTLVEHLFRREAGKLLAVLTRLLGLHNLELAEDVVQDTLCQALEVWKYDRVPDNPSAWLMRVARNRALDVIRKHRTERKFAPELSHMLDSEGPLAPALTSFFYDREIQDEQLRLMFSCCASGLPPETQVALILKLLCGFSVREIAAAFLTGEAAMEKRLVRGKQVLKETGTRVLAEPEAALHERLEVVHQALYLLFNEGYHASHAELPVRGELCHEALYLCTLLAEHPVTGTPMTHALAALMCLHAARLPTRLDATGALVPLEEQDRGRWDQELMERGVAHLRRAATARALAAITWRRASPRPMARRRAWRRPTGTPSSGCTTPSCTCTRPRWWRSIGRS